MESLSCPDAVLYCVGPSTDSTPLTPQRRHAATPPRLYPPCCSANPDNRWCFSAEALSSRDTCKVPVAGVGQRRRSCVTVSSMGLWRRRTRRAPLACSLSVIADAPSTVIRNQFELALPTSLAKGKVSVHWCLGGLLAPSVPALASCVLANDGAFNYVPFMPSSSNGSGKRRRNPGSKAVIPPVARVLTCLDLEAFC